MNVRAFGYRAMRQLPHGNNTQYTGDTVYALEEPYEWAALMAPAGSGTAGFVGPAGDLSKIVRIEVPDGSAIRYEINPPGRAVAAGNQSPKLTGTDVFPWDVGYSISVVDASAYP